MDYRTHFPITEQFAYLDHAAAGPPSTDVIEAVTAFLWSRARKGSLFMGEAKAMCERTRGKMAAMIGATPDEIAYTKNTPDGLNLVANGLTWRKGDNVVTCDIEFPANVYPWMNLRDFGVDIRFVKTDNGIVATDDILAAMDDRTRVVALSWVEFHGGYRNDLATIGSACRSREILLAVDAIQGVGALALDVRALNVDFAAFSAQKWMLAPHAVGIFYCREELIDKLRVAVAGQTSVELGPKYLDYALTFRPNAGRFEPGFINQVGIAGLEAAIDLFSAVGTDAVESRVLELAQRIRGGAKRLGCEVLGSEDPSQGSGVISFRAPACPADDLKAALEAAGVVVSSREGYIRAAPHFYNTEAEIDRMLDVVESKGVAERAGTR